MTKITYDQRTIYLLNDCLDTIVKGHGYESYRWPELLRTCVQQICDKLMESDLAVRDSLVYSETYWYDTGTNQFLLGPDWFCVVDPDMPYGYYD